MIMWPSVLPQYLNVAGYQEQAGNQMLRSSMEAGPQKVRRRFTASPRPLSAQLLLTPAQLTFFKYWYEYVLLGGTLRFGWVDPWSNLVLTNLLTNGGFDSSTTGWEVYQCTISSISGGIYGNCLELTMASGDYQDAQQNLTLSVGNLYNHAGWVKSGLSGNESGDFGAWDVGGSLLAASFVSSDEWMYYHGTFTCENAATSVGVAKISATAGTMFFDEVTLYDITDGVTELRFTEPPSWDTPDGLNITLNMSLEILP